VRRTLLAKRSAARARRAATDAQAAAGDVSARPSASATVADSQLLQVFERVVWRWDALSMWSTDHDGQHGGGDTGLHFSSGAMQSSQQSATDGSEPLAATPSKQRASRSGRRRTAASQD
jgi:hypothetical protein